MTRPMVFYRSNLTRVAFAVTGLVLAWTFSPWATQAQWRDAPSLRWLHAVMPWSLLSILFAVYSLLLLWGRIEAVAVADGVGAVLWGWEFCASIATLSSGGPKNSFLITGTLLVTTYHLAAARLAIIAAARGDR